MSNPVPLTSELADNLLSEVTRSGRAIQRSDLVFLATTAYNLGNVDGVTGVLAPANTVALDDVHKRSRLAEVARLDYEEFGGDARLEGFVDTLIPSQLDVLPLAAEVLALRARVLELENRSV
jgi:hypothetical protein